MFNRRSILAGAAIGALSLVAADAYANAPSSSRLSVRRGRLFIDASINHHPAIALLDTAAELTLVDRGFAARIGLEGGESVEARGSGAGVEAASLVEGVAISAAGVASDNATVAIIDLSDVSRRLNGAPISLILGRDYFALSRFEVDISRRVFRALPAQSSPAGRHETLLEEFGTLALGASAEGHDAHAVVDLGNGNIPLISRNFSERLGALTDGRPIGLDRGGGIGGAADRQSFHLSRLDVGGRSFHGVRVAVDAGQNASDLNLGASILRHFQMTLDFAQKQMWLQ